MIKQKLDKITEAKYLAIKLHSAQQYGDYPYIAHLEDVVNVLKHFGYFEKHIISGYLHDSLEDTSISFNNIKDKFGIEIARIILAVTDELGENRKEKHLKTYPKIKLNHDAQIIKVADRIANLENSIIESNKKFIELYIKEYPFFKESIYIEGVCDLMWDYLESLISKSVDEIIKFENSVYKN